MFRLSTKTIEKFLLPSILILSFFLRFYNFPFRYSFGEDSIRDALVALEGARQLQLPLTGSFSSLGPFTFGPWYYYQLILFSLTKLPFAPWIFMSLASIGFVYLMYKIGVKLQDKTLGILLALMASVSSSQISTGIELTNPNLIPFYSALCILLFIKISEKNLPLRLSFITGLILGVGVNIHYQMAGLLILPLVLLLKKNRRLSEVAFSYLGVLTSFIPLLVFDLNNHWYNLRNLIYYYREGHKLIYVPNRWLFYIRDFWPSFVSYSLGVDKIIGSIGTFAILISIITVVRKTFRSKLFFLTIAFIFNFLLLRYYTGPRGYSYLEYMYPFVFIFVAYFLKNLIKLIYLGKYLSYLTIALLFAFMLEKSITLLSPDQFNVYMQKQAGVLATYNGYLSFYNCKNNYKFRTESIVYLLSLRNKLSDNGRKLAFKDKRCLNSSGENSEIFGNLGILDLSSASLTELSKKEWGHISPKVIYNSTVRWWFNEQP